MVNNKDRMKPKSLSNQHNQSDQNQMTEFQKKKINKNKVFLNQVVQQMKKMMKIHQTKRNPLILLIQILLIKKIEKIKNHLLNMVMDIGLNSCWHILNSYLMEKMHLGILFPDWVPIKKMKILIWEIDY